MCSVGRRFPQVVLFGDGVGANVMLRVMVCVFRNMCARDATLVRAVRADAAGPASARRHPHQLPRDGRRLPRVAPRQGARRRLLPPLPTCCARVAHKLVCKCNNATSPPAAGSALDVRGLCTASCVLCVPVPVPVPSDSTAARCFDLRAQRSTRAALRST